MTLPGGLQIAVFLALTFALTRPFGLYLFRVFEDERRPLASTLGRAERLVLRLCGVRGEEQTWDAYARSLLLFGAVCTLSTYALLRLQHLLPFNPQGFGPVAPGLAFNAAASFATNTDWQSYSGEKTLSHLSQMLALTWQGFASAATGLAAALAFARGLTRRPGPDGARTLGNFWVDLLRATLYVLLPVCVGAALVLGALGVVQSLGGAVQVFTPEGAVQRLFRGPAASQEAIKLFGTNGGGVFGANSAHPFENPSPLSNLLEMLLVFALPSALTNTYGRMAPSPRHGWVLWRAMALLFLAGAGAAYAAESGANPALAGLELSAGGNLEGKETRFGVAGSALFAVVATASSCGAVNAQLGSFNPAGGLVALVNMQLGEVAFGGVGTGLLSLLVFALVSVFIAGLMVGRTPEYLGKKIEAREMKLAMLVVLLFPLLVLVPAAAALGTRLAAGAGSPGPHGLSEVLYAYTSAAANNGSAFSGLSPRGAWWDLSLGLVMLGGRYLPLVPVLAVAGSMLNKKVAPPGRGTLPTDGWLFTGLLVVVVLVVGALVFFPALALGPVAEHFAARAGRRF